MLIEYENLSNGMVVFEFLNPNEDEEMEMEAMQNGIQPVDDQYKGKGSNEAAKSIFRGIIQLGDQKEVIPFLQPGAAMEYALSLQ